MVKVCLEVREGDGIFRVTVRAESISQAVSFANGSYPDRDVRVVFPIDPGEFFAEAPNATVGTAVAGGYFSDSIDRRGRYQRGTIHSFWRKGEQ
jgi:hypothetical protein